MTYPNDYRIASFHSGTRDRYGYRSDPEAPRIEVLPETRPAFQEFDEPREILACMSSADRHGAIDPLNLPTDRARVHRQQLDVMLRQVKQRQAISDAVQQGIDCDEAAIHSKLDEMRYWPILAGHGSRLEADLEKRLLTLRKDRWDEVVSCWRDTSRLLTTVLEQWSEYEDETRKARLMDFAL